MIPFRSINQKDQFFAKIVSSFLVFLCCVSFPGIARAGFVEDVRDVSREFVGEVSVATGRIVSMVPEVSPASLALAWQGFTCFFGFNCPGTESQTVAVDSESGANKPQDQAGDTRSETTQIPPAQPAPIIQTQPEPVEPARLTQADIDEMTIAYANKPDPAQSVQNIYNTYNPVIEVREVKTVVQIDEETSARLDLLERQLDSDRPNYSLGSSYTLPDKITGRTFKNDSETFTVDENGNVVVKGDLAVDGAQTYSGAVNISLNSADPLIEAAQSGSGFAVLADNIALKDSTISTNDAGSNLIVSPKGDIWFYSSGNTIDSGGNLGLEGNITASGTGSNYLAANLGLGVIIPAEALDINGRLRLAQTAAPTVTTDKLYNVDGNLYWNGAALALGSSVSGTAGYLPKFTASNALGNSALYEAGGNVGIGTTSPGEMLHIGTNSSTVDNYIKVQTSAGHIAGVKLVGGDLGIWHLAHNDTGNLLQLGLDSSEIVTLTSAGNVGIGTTAPGAKLDVTGNVYFHGGTTYTNDFAGYSNGGGISFTVNGPSFFTADDDSILFSTTPSGVVSERMRITSAGNVGIGTTSPNYKLVVNGNIGTPPASVDGTVLQVVGADNAYSRVMIDGFNKQISIAGRRANGTAAAPSALSLNDAIASFNAYGYGLTGYTTFNRGYVGFKASENWSDAAQGTDLIFGTNANGVAAPATTKMILTNAGNVGIGTTAPEYKLQLTAAGETSPWGGIVFTPALNDSGDVNVLQGNFAAGFNVGHGSASGGYIDAGAWYKPAGIYFVTGNGSASPTEKLTILNNGNVGIGTTAPRAKLDVDGVIRAQTAIIAGMNVQVLSANKTLTPGADKMYQYLDPNGAARSITLATENAVAGDRFIVSNNGAYNSSYYLTIYQSTTVLDYIYAGSIKEYVFNGSNWVAGSNGSGGNDNMKRNVALGYDARGYSYGTALGYGAHGYSDGAAVGYNSKGYSYGAALGSNAMGIRYGVSVGYQAGTGQSTLYDLYNVLVGAYAGYQLTGGSGIGLGNIMVGYQTGYDATYSPTIGSKNILIGYQAGAPSNSTSNFLNIGNAIFATGINNSTFPAISAANVGIGTTAPTTKFTVRNDSSGALADILRVENLGTAAINSGAGMQFILNRTTGGATEFGRIDQLATSIDNTYYSGALRFKIASNGTLETIAEFGNPNIVLNRPLEVNVAGDTGISYDLQLMSSGTSHITSNGPLVIAAGDINSAENLMLTTQSNEQAGDTGTATAGAATTVTDSAKAWTADEWIGGTVTIISGNGKGQTQTITDNNATSVTVADWDTTLGDPAANSVYRLAYAPGGDVLVDVVNSNNVFGGFKILGNDNGGYAFRVAPDGDVFVGGEGAAGSDLFVKQNITVYGGIASIRGLDIVGAGTPTATSATSGGSCADSTAYYYKVTAVNDNGETVGTSQFTVTTGASGTNVNLITVAWSTVTGATGYKIYRSTENNDWDGDINDFWVDGRVVAAPMVTYYDNCSGDTGSLTPPATNTTGGKLAVGLATPTYALDVLSGSTNIARFNGTNNTGCTLSDGGVIACSSDARLKKNVIDIVYGINDLMALRPVSFNWNSDEEGASTTIGFIAQEVEGVFPKLVMTDGNGYKELNTIGLVPVLTKAVQEQQGQIQEMRELMLAMAISGDGLLGDTSAESLNQKKQTLIGWLTGELRDLGVSLYHGVARIMNLEVGSSQQPSGITVYDQTTKEPYCIMVDNGEMKHIKGKCEPVTIEKNEENQQNQETVDSPAQGEGSGVADDDTEENNASTTEDIIIGPAAPQTEAPAEEAAQPEAEEVPEPQAQDSTEEPVVVAGEDSEIIE